MKKILFHTNAYTYLAKTLLAEGKYEEGHLELSHFADGERYQRILTKVEDRKVIVLGGTINDSSTLELYDLCSTLVKLGARSLSIVIPYFGYSTMERAVKDGEVVTAKTRARLFSSIPRSTKGNRVYLFDLHTEGLPHYFEGHLRTVHVYCKDIIMKAVRDYGGSNCVLASTDAGRAKWVESLANDLGLQAAFALKRRLSGTETEITAINADVKDKTVIIYDDMIRSGSSLINAAQAYNQAGAKEIFVITTHGVFVDGSIEKLKSSGVIKKIICTDTHANTQTINDAFVEVRSIADLIKRVL
ncbi:MAG: ribose-phosphate pyrophosphokinase [Halioglobus sp.]|jgi:ribose-phosphate pyrophosphokinase